RPCITATLYRRDPVTLGPPCGGSGVLGSYGGASQDLTPAKYRDRPVLADRNDDGPGGVVAVAATRSVAGALEPVDIGFGSIARDQTHSQLAQHSIAVEHRGPVDLGQGVA